MLEQIGKHSGMDLTIRVKGDLEVDEHHTIEDTAIALGECIYQALGSKRGIERYGYALPMDDCLCQVCLDFGGRPWLVWDAEFKREKIGEMPTEMFLHFFKSLSDAAKMNLNIKAEGQNEHHKIEGIFKALARALKMAIKRDIYHLNFHLVRVCFNVFRIISILLMQKQIPLCLLAIVLSVSLFGQNLKADKIILSDSDLTNLYQIDSGVYRSEQPSKEGFKALEKYGIGEVFNLRNRHSDDDEAKGTSIKLHRVKTKAHSISEKQLIQALRIIKNRKAPIVFHCHHGSDRTGAVCAFYRIIFRMFQKKMQSMK